MNRDVRSLPTGLEVLMDLGSLLFGAIPAGQLATDSPPDVFSAQRNIRLQTQYGLSSEMPALLVQVQGLCTEVRVPSAQEVWRC